LAEAEPAMSAASATPKTVMAFIRVLLTNGVPGLRAASDAGSNVEQHCAASKPFFLGSAMAGGL
jgi:hypothetical protein